MTPMHLVAKKCEVDRLTELLLVCPESIRNANVNGETAVHITVRNDRCDELKILRGWMQRLRNNDALSIEIKVLNRVDREGNTALHVAAYKNSHQTCFYLSLNFYHMCLSGSSVIIGKVFKCLIYSLIRM